MIIANWTNNKATPLHQGHATTLGEISFLLGSENN